MKRINTTLICVLKKGKNANKRYIIHSIRLISTTSKNCSKSKIKPIRASIIKPKYINNKSLAATSKRTLNTNTTNTTNQSQSSSSSSSIATTQKRSTYSQSTTKWKKFGGGYMQTGHRADGYFNPEIPPRILVTGASGQIGTELVPYLRNKFGRDNVVASDVKVPIANKQSTYDGPFVFLDTCDYNSIARVCMENQIDWIFHMAALLSAVGEKDPKLAIKINNVGVENTLEVARLNDMRIYIPSSIAAFGDSTPQQLTPQLTVQRPRTIYGITKVYSELLGEYYHERYGVDFRSLRYPGIISSKAMPGGGTTDYAVEIYHEALQYEHYKCFLAAETMLPMMYMPDCIKSTITIMEAPQEQLKHRVYNVTGVSFTPQQQAESIKKRMPNFTIDYVPDFRQNIAATWPQTIDDSEARQDWGWQEDYGLQEMTDDMLESLKPFYQGLP